MITIYRSSFLSVTMVTAQTCHGNCIEMLLNPLSFLFDLLCHCTVNYNLYLFVGKSTGIRLNTALFKLIEFMLVRISYQFLGNCTDPSSNCTNLF